MALGTVTVVDRGAFGDLFTRLVDVVLPASYAAGGYTITAAQLGLGINGVIKAVTPVSGASLSSALSKYVLPVWDGSKLLVVNVLTGVEVVDTTDLSAITVRLLVLGQGQG